MGMRLIHNAGIAVAWALIVAGGLIFFQGRIVFLFSPTIWGVKDSSGSGLVASFLIGIPLMVLGGVLRRSLGKSFLPLRSEETTNSSNSDSPSSGA